MHYMYSATLRYAGFVDHPDDCLPMCTCTTDEPPATPWPDGHWPYYLDNGWELIEVNTR